MEWLALLILGAGAYFLDSSIQDRAPLKFIQSIITDPTNIASKWESSAHQGGRALKANAPDTATASPDTTTDSNATTVPGGSAVSEFGEALKPTGVTNGKLPNSILAAIPWATNFKVWDAALPSLELLNKAYKAEFGSNLVISSAYRTYAEQYTLKENPLTARLASAPGHSNHGYGDAVDFGGGIQTFYSKQYNWMIANAPKFGWIHPTWSAPGGSLPEAWHWQYYPQGASSIASAAPKAPISGSASF